MLKRVALVAVSAVAILMVVGWLNRKPIILHMVTNAERFDVAEHEPVVWSEGPDTADTPLAERRGLSLFALCCNSLCSRRCFRAPAGCF